MKLSRKASVLAVAIALLATGCSGFAPKAGVGVKGVSVDLAFGIDVEDILTNTPTITPPLPTLPPPTSAIPSSTPTVIPPPPPVLCPPVGAGASTKDGAAPTTIKNQDFKRQPSNLEGSKPREGKYFSWFQFNFSSEEVEQGYSYREVDRLHNIQVGGGFAYELLQPEAGHAIDVTYVVVPQPEGGAGAAGGDVAGIYIQELMIPFKDRPSGPIQKRKFTVFEPGTRLVEFPIANGNRSSDSQPVPETPDAGGDTPTIGGAANVMSITSVVGERDRIFVCSELADAWRVSVTLELTGDVDVRIVGNFWLAPQYGGWPIQEAFTIDGGADHVSGNFFSRLARLDPGSIG